MSLKNANQLDPDQAGKAEIAWNTLVNAIAKHKGVSYKEAIAEAVRDHGDTHERFLAEYNERAVLRQSRLRRR